MVKRIGYKAIPYKTAYEDWLHDNVGVSYGMVVDVYQPIMSDDMDYLWNQVSNELSNIQMDTSLDSSDMRSITKYEGIGWAMYLVMYYDPGVRSIEYGLLKELVIVFDNEIDAITFKLVQSSLEPPEIPA